MNDILLESAWADPAAVAFSVRYTLHSLSTSGFDDMLIGTSTVPPDAAAQHAFLEECRAVIAISLENLLVPAAKADIPKVMCALRHAMLALSHLSLDAICDDMYRKAPEYRPYIYSEAELVECDAVLTQYLDVVQSPSVRNDPAKIMAAVQHAVEALNDLHDRCGRSLIGTDGREDICDLIQGAAKSAGLSCDDMDITDEWRDW